MKLYGSNTSPYVRKVRIQALEGEYWDQIDFFEMATAPTNPNMDNINPLKKVPALETDDGQVLFDSRVVCEYLDQALGGGRTFPADGNVRWEALRLQALGDGLLDAALLARYEHSLRPELARWNDWYDGQMMKIDGALAEMEGSTASFGDRMDIGTITVACALGYLDFRFPKKDWRNSNTALTAWFEVMMARPSVSGTVPPQ